MTRIGRISTDRSVLGPRGSAASASSAFYWAAVFCGCLACAALLVSAGAASRQGAKADAILKRFADEFIALTPGKGKYPASFVMGSDGGPKDERPAHQVTLRKPFALAKYEVTQELYQVIAGNNPSRWKGPRNSVEMVSWDEAVAFCGKVTKELRRLGLLGKGEVIRLPSEAEWEYACRAGTTTAYSFGGDADELTKYAWFTGNARGNDPPVGVKKANPWGFYDMHGYVWEWCADAWHASYAGAPDDGSAWDAEGAKERVIRGGAWTEPAERCRSASRGHVPAEMRTAAIGFRCVRAADK
jgi:formylglycine-generating enzyme required for sulfatase activity